MPSFSLSDKPWLPVKIGTQSDRVGLRALFLRAHQIDDLTVALPPAAAGLWRILPAITARITGLDDHSLGSAGWETVRAAVVRDGVFDPTRVNQYFDRWSDRFDLFHPYRPWLQDPRLREQCGKASGINKLAFDRPAGSNQVWFGHFTDTEPEPIPADEAALHLIAQLYYGASGRCTSRTVGSITEANTVAGPLRGILSYHPIGRTVFETLLAGLPPLSAGLADAQGIKDECPWESGDLPNPLGRPPFTWPGSMLTARFRHAILLVPDADGEAAVDAYVTWAWRTAAANHRDPYAIGHLSKDGQRWYGRPASADRALWRDLDSLLLSGEIDSGRGRPAVLTGCRNLSYLDSLRIRALGFDQDGQTRDRQWFVATTPPVLSWLEEVNPDAAWATHYARENAEKVGDQMREALRKAWKMISPEVGPWPVRAESYYWPRAEDQFWRIVETPTAEHLAGALSSFVDVAAAAIEYAVGNREQLRVARAYDDAQRRLRSVLTQGERK